MQANIVSTPYDIYISNKILVAFLLKQGVSWEAIQEMSAEEISEFVDVFTEIEKLNAEKISGGK